MESKLKAKYIVDIMDETTKRRVQKIIDSTRDFVQEQAEQGIDLIELAQVMLSMSREAMVDVYGEVVADSYIKQQISYLKNPENSLTLH
jgi:hypothetical protein|tara:strand:- start:98 stop:364 length:267 start_codon:yes stop_codon:yes gene_type:complete